MAEYKIECEQFLGFSHSGSVTTSGESTIELSDEEEWKAKNGQTLRLDTKEEKVLLKKGNSLIAVYKRKNENTFVPERGLF
jgi:hypothetical protein